ncbi:DUF1876 domain-containing protein [Streptomyces sp. XM83C]|jgi:hypothetical protein|uniref:dsRBD fold-containing protein n=1 Tax=unclassified Streptomyces TaxID=2593676 RepID=UPI001FF8A544|nr:dsRBD fold-containing protein [Streptomyces sp. XM83C]MCK1822644.1 DUF1876 domain-containing protein [Streptomyces sp. XM83C]
MAHTTEWQVHLRLVEDETGTTKAEVVLDTGHASLSGHGVAQRNPADENVPEIGDELAAGRAMSDLGRQLVTLARQDLRQMSPTEPEPELHPATGWLS